MEEKSPHPLLRQAAVELEIAVLVVAEHRVTGVSEVHADLVGATCQQPDFEQAEVRGLSSATRTWVTALFPSSRTATRRSPLASTYLCSDSSQLARAALGQAPLTIGEVDLLHLPVAQHAVQLDQRAALLEPRSAGPRCRGPAGARAPGASPAAATRAATRSPRSSRRCRRAPPPPRACRSTRAPRLRARSGIRPALPLGFCS